MARVRPHFKAHTSISHHRLMREVYPDNDLLSLWLRLGLVAIDRFAAKSGDTFRVHKRELGQLAGGKRADKAEAMLNKLCTSLELTWNKDGDYFEIEWRNLSKKQGFDLKNVTPLNTDTETDAETDEESAPTDALFDGCEVLLSHKDVTAMREMAPGGHLYSARQVQAWFQYKLPELKDRGYRNLPKAAKNWWKRANRQEILNGEQWLTRIKLQKSHLVEAPSEEESQSKQEDFQEFAALFGANKTTRREGEKLVND